MSKASLKAKRKELVRFFNVVAGRIKPAIKAKKHGFIKDFGVVGNNPGAYIKLGLYRKRKVIS